MRQLFPVVIIGLALLGACQSNHIKPYDTIQCQCQGACPANRCNFTVTLASTCKSRADVAEVLIDSYLELAVATPSKPLVSCYSIAVGEKASVIVRSDDWEWGPQEEHCTAANAGGTVALVLDCCECVTDADCAAIGRTTCLPDCLCGL